MALEMAHQLREQGQGIGLVAVLDSLAPGDAQKIHRRPVQQIVDMTHRVALHSRNFLQLGPRYVKERAKVKRVNRNNMRALRRYIPKPYPGRVTLLWADERPADPTDRRLGWRALASGGLDVRVIPGDHSSMMKEPHVQVLAQELRSALDAARSGGTAGGI